MGCAAMGGVNTEGDWVGYQFVLLSFPLELLQELAQRTLLIDMLVCSV